MPSRATVWSKLVLRTCFGNARCSGAVTAEADSRDNRPLAGSEDGWPGGLLVASEGVDSDSTVSSTADIPRREEDAPGIGIVEDVVGPLGEDPDGNLMAF